MKLKSYKAKVQQLSIYLNFNYSDVGSAYYNTIMEMTVFLPGKTIKNYMRKVIK